MSRGANDHGATGIVIFCAHGLIANRGIFKHCLQYPSAVIGAGRKTNKGCNREQSFWSQQRLYRYYQTRPGCFENIGEATRWPGRCEYGEAGLTDSSDSMTRLKAHKLAGSRATQHGAMEFTTSPTDLDKVRFYRRDRICEQLLKHDYAAILLLDPLNIRYACDATNMQIWCTHYETRCLLLMADGKTVLFDYADHPHLVKGLATIDDYQVMDVFYYFAAGSKSADRAKGFARQIQDSLQKYAASNKRLAIDRLSHRGVDALRDLGLQIFDGQEATEIARSIKSTEELELIRATIEVAEMGMDAMKQALTPGITENALWAKLHECNIANGGEWIETRLLASGPRTNPWFHECSMRPIETGDIVCFDTDMIGPYGYCADLSRAWVCGDTPTAVQKELYKMSFDQLHHDIDILKPGMSFKAVSEKCWPNPAEFQKNRYSCMIHGVGLADEWPSIPYSQDYAQWGYEGILKPGMLLCVESYVGREGGDQGVKLEDMVLITETGTQTLSTYPFDKALLGQEVSDL